MLNINLADPNGGTLTVAEFQKAVLEQDNGVVSCVVTMGAWPDLASMNANANSVPFIFSWVGDAFNASAIAEGVPNFQALIEQACIAQVTPQLDENGQPISGTNTNPFASATEAAGSRR